MYSLNWFPDTEPEVSRCLSFEKVVVSPPRMSLYYAPGRCIIPGQCGSTLVCAKMTIEFLQITIEMLTKL